MWPNLIIEGWSRNIWRGRPKNIVGGNPASVYGISNFTYTGLGLCQIAEALHDRCRSLTNVLHRLDTQLITLAHHSQNLCFWTIMIVQPLELALSNLCAHGLHHLFIAFDDSRCAPPRRRAFVPLRPLLVGLGTFFCSFLNRSTIIPPQFCRGT